MLSTAELDRLAKDTGCEMHDDCLTCPLSECIYDTGFVRVDTQKRYIKIRRMSEHLGTDEIAEQLGICAKTVRRALRRSSKWIEVQLQ